jgi:hypothetical protein
MTEDSRPAQNRNWLSEGVLLALSTAVAYGVAFAFETGYADYFGYPWWLIQVDLGKLLTAWAAVLTAAALLFVFLSSFAILLPSQIARIFLFNIVIWNPLMFLGLYTWAIWGFPNTTLSSRILLALVQAMWFAITSARLLLDYRRAEGDGFLKRLEIATAKGRQYIKESFTKDSLADRITDHPIGLRIMQGGWLGITLLFVLLVGSHVLARRFAARPGGQFVTVLGDTTFVGVRQYGGLIVAVRLSPHGRQMANTYRLLATNDPTVVWRIRELPTLTRAPVSPPQGGATK